MRASDVQHRGYEGDRESHRLYCTYVHHSSKIFLVRTRKAKGTPPARAPALLASASQPSPPGHGGGRSWQRSCHCRGSIWCALVGVWHCTWCAILVPTARQQGVDGDEASSGAAR